MRLLGGCSDVLFCQLFVQPGCTRTYASTQVSIPSKIIISEHLAEHLRLFDTRDMRPVDRPIIRQTVVTRQ